MNENHDFAGHEPWEMLFDKPIVYAQAEKMNGEPARTRPGQSGKEKDREPHQLREAPSQPQSGQPGGASPSNPEGCPPKQTLPRPEALDMDVAIFGLFNESGTPYALTPQLSARPDGITPVVEKTE